MRKSILFLALSPLISPAQTNRTEIYANPELAAGVYYAYPIKESLNTPPPSGYKPFYISHYGRHGSRYLISDNDYKWIVDLMHDARSKNALTPLGLATLDKLDIVWAEAQGRGGELTPLGHQQHRDIAHRMFHAFPEVFNASPEITASSTTVMRCSHSMFAFIEGLKELKPSLSIPRESSSRNMDFLNYHSAESYRFSNKSAAWNVYSKNFEQEKTNPDRLVGSLFSDISYIQKNVNPQKLMRDLYYIAVDLQNMEANVDLLGLFTPDELFDLWEIENFNFYATNSSYPLADGQHIDNAKNLLQHMISTADRYISEGKNGATLRFGHDGNIIPLTALMQFPNCTAYVTQPSELSKVYSNFKISPMASNVQLVFFRNKQRDVIVKFMLNEREVSIPAHTDIYPFYKWADARATLQSILDTPSREFIPSD